MEVTTELRAPRRLGRKSLFAWGGILSAASVVAISVVASAASVTPRSVHGGGVSSITIAGITGEGSGNGPGTIAIESWSFGESNHSSVGIGAIAGAGKVTMNSFSFTKMVDKASTSLFIDCATGKHLATAILNVQPPLVSGVPSGDSLQITLTNVLISSYSLNSGGDNPQESLSLNFTKIQMKYVPQDPAAASSQATYDLKANKAS